MTAEQFMAAWVDAHAETNVRVYGMGEDAARRDALAQWDEEAEKLAVGDVGCYPRPTEEVARSFGWRG